MLLTELLGIPGLGLQPVVPGRPRERRVRGVYTTDLPDPGRFIDGGELVLTSTTWYRQPRDADVFVAALVAGAVAVVELPGALAEACGRYGLPLFTVGDEVSYAVLTETVLAALAGPVGRSPGAGLHRGLVASMASGAGPEGLVEVLARSTGVWCTVLSATGRPTAGVLSEVSDRHLQRAFREALSGGAFPSVRPLPTVTTVTGRSVSRTPPPRCARCSRWTAWPGRSADASKSGSYGSRSTWCGRDTATRPRAGCAAWASASAPR